MAGNSRIQFASNQSKLVPRKLDRGTSSKVGLRPKIVTNSYRDTIFHVVNEMAQHALGRAQLFPPCCYCVPRGF
jgi:hypothetical protein